MTKSEFTSTNEAMLAVDDDERWNALNFLRFDDQLARKARLQGI